MPEQAFWTPSEAEVEEASLTKFRQFVNDRHNLALRDYWELWRWSTGSPEEMNDFWTAVWDFTGVVGEKGRAPLFNAAVPIYETRRFCTNARLNWAENMLLGHPHARSKEHLAVISLIEPADAKASREQQAQQAHIRSLTFEDLYIEVAQAAGALRKLGVRQGDRVAAVTSNNAEAVVMVLATTAIGAIWSSVAPEFGVSSILERFVQLRPKVLLVCDRYRAAGKQHDVVPKMEEVVKALKPVGLETVVIVGQLEKDRRPTGPSVNVDGIRTIAWPDFLDRTANNVPFVRVLGNTPLWVLYSSGTTGKPKAIIHGHCGMVLAIKQGGPLHSALSEKDVHLQITTTGWMMWNHMVNHLCIGATILTYDGNPLVPNKLILFDFIERYKVTSFSLSPRYLQVLLQGNLRPNRSHKTSSLRSICSAGSPLKPDLYEYIKSAIGHVYIQNVSGGTDVCAGLVGGCPVLPIYAGKIQCAWLGVALVAYGEDGSPVPQGGEGDLVIEKPMPFMPLGFLGDDANDSRLKDAYFNHYSHTSVWYHADHVAIDENGGITMLGRSDGVLNPQGVRFGSAELYAVVEEMKDEVDDCIAIGQKTPDGDERVILFVKPMSAGGLDQKLVRRIQDAITAKLSRRHVPAKIIECPEIPYTVNGKRVEVAVKKIVNGTSPSKLNTSGLANAGALQWFVNLPELAFSPVLAKL
ncbi:acetoacetyl-CoA synthase [Cystobasidium minutum MCA 4210]|uniref:acetoacetyl-CoA synthase n=1 Tax=Cystobasidium minutum MCA 4210 TaxID=1397322 RepID=UPI0034CD22A1|eukprot:jgi/Rhomi1/172140/fgenesh1_kg.4_\